MTKYVKVKEAPEDLQKGEVVISSPNFCEEISKVWRRAPKNGYTTSNFMRDCAAAIGEKYMREDFNALMTVNTSRYRGLPFETVEDVNEIVKKMLASSTPQVFSNYVDYHIKQRPVGTKLVYFLGDHSETEPFVLNGLDEIKSKEVETYMGRKLQKKVGKSAVKNSEKGAPETTTESENMV